MMFVVGHLRPPEVAGDDDELRFDRLQVDLAIRRVWLDETEVALTFAEFELLARLVENRGQVQTYETLLDEVWGDGSGATPSTVDAHVRVLVRKLKLSKDLHKIRGVGFELLSGTADGQVDTHGFELAPVGA